MSINLDPTLLAQVVDRAMRDAAQYPRWTSAIDRAARELETNPYIEALDDHTLLIGSASGGVYTANGVCGCQAYQHGQPCFHRAAARLYQRYVEADAKSAQPTEHISVQARKAYAAASGPNRPLFADRDAETMRRQALGEERAQLEEMRLKRQAAAAKATASINELFN